jgi:TfoX/Sxy family transcriptional regulator of competence genes
VAYDEERAARIRDLVSAEQGVEEKTMFGGLAFLVDGNMAVAASGQGGLLARVDPAESDELVETTPAEEMVMRGRSMKGWLRVDSKDVEGDELDVWVERGLAFALAAGQALTHMGLALRPTLGINFRDVPASSRDRARARGKPRRPGAGRPGAARGRPSCPRHRLT